MRCLAGSARRSLVAALSATFVFSGYPAPLLQAGTPLQRAEKTGCRHCDCSQPKTVARNDWFPSFPSSFAAVPTGPIVESIPVVRATPALVSVPMMIADQKRAVSACESERMDELEERVEALFVQLKVIQRAVEIQTAVLERQLREKQND